MKNVLLTVACVVTLQLSANAQGTTYFTAPTTETIQNNALMPADSGMFFCMKKNTTSSSAYWLQNNSLTELKSIGGQYAIVNNVNGTYGKQWFTNGNKALFVVINNGTVQGSAIWVSDGTPTGTDTVLSFKYGTNVNIAGMVNNELYFSTTQTSPSYKTTLYKTNFTQVGTSVVKIIANTNLTRNYVDNGKLYLEGYIKTGSSYYNILYAYNTDTTRLLLGYTADKVINDNLYYFGYGQYKRKNLITNVTTTLVMAAGAGTSGNIVNHITHVLGVFKGRLYVKASFTGVNNIADLRIYSGDISNPSTSTITFNELVSNTGSSIILSNGAFLYSFANNVAYFTGINNLGGNLSIFATDSGNVNTHVVQELMTAASWISTSEGRFYLCNDQLYFYGADYKIGTTLYAGRNLSTCDSTSGSLKEVVLNAGANATIENMVNFKESLIFSIGSLTSNQLYAIHACASAPIATNALQDYNNASNTTIYPNPNNGTFTIHTPTNATVVIYNMLGEIVYNYTTNASTTPLALTLTTGVYVAKTISTTGSSTTKFIVE